VTEHPRGLVASAGWPVVHLYYRIDRSRWRALGASDRRAAIDEFQQWLSQCATEDGLQLVPMAGVTKSDFAVVAIHPDLWRLQQLTQELAATTFGACLHEVYSFLSMTEASEYITNELDWSKLLIDEQKVDPASPEFATRIGQLRKRTAMYADSRIHPHLPDTYPVICFYPMAKSRRDQDNWYRLSFEQRKQLMIQHGNSGRRFADRITQLITTCTGIDDWEWGVTLFSKDLKAIRDIVYELRYDEASAIYGLFGEFYIGIRFTPEQLATVLKL
ncbi:MAG TPA: chlorite dismutase family protein, partial [Candidatus Acidoferrales bacterium]|nr:chlorite dismutase family protein [Candidatus Acidoferrales bacterium]